MDLTNVTLDGVPIAAVIAEEQAAEVEQHRRAEVKAVSVKAHIVTKNHRSSRIRPSKLRSLKADERLLAQMFVSGTMTTAELSAEISKIGKTTAAERKVARYAMAVEASGLSKGQVTQLLSIGWTVERIAERLNGRRLR